MLPERFHFLADRDFAQADLLIIMGSSLVVQPFASLVDRYVLVKHHILISLNFYMQLMMCVHLTIIFLKGPT